MQSAAFINELVSSAQNGDEWAWNILYQHYYPKLYVTALRICRSVPDAKDLVQDSFITAYLKLSQLKDAANFESWIRRILIHNAYRRITRNRKNESADGLYGIAEDELRKHVETQLDQGPLNQKIYSVLMELSENLLIALLLRYFTKFNSYNDIATILSVPVGTVRSRLNEAKLKLTALWNQPLNKSIYNVDESQEWNHFYYEAYSNLHYKDSHKDMFLNHLGKNVKINFPGGKVGVGNTAFEKLIIDDKKHGSWLSPMQVLSCGNISIIEAKHFNSSAYPDHCPPKSVAVLYRKKKEVEKLNLHLVFE